jgi:hypothetical protein
MTFILLLLDLDLDDKTLLALTRLLLGVGGFAASAGIGSGSGEGVRNSSAGGFDGGNFPVRERVSRILITGVGGRGEDLVLVLEIVTQLLNVTRMAAALLHVAVLERNLLNAAKETFYRLHPRE